MCVYIHIYIYIYILGLSRLDSEFTDVVFEDVVFENISCVTADYGKTHICVGNIYYYQTPHPQSPHP